MELAWPTHIKSKVRHNHALLGTEFSYATLTLPNAWLISSLSLPPGGTLLQHKAVVYWMVKGWLIFKWVFLLFCPIPVCIYLYCLFTIHWWDYIKNDLLNEKKKCTRTRTINKLFWPHSQIEIQESFYVTKTCVYTNRKFTLPTSFRENFA